MNCTSSKGINKICNGKLIKKENKVFTQWGIKYYTEIYICSKCGEEYTGSTYRIDNN